MGNQFSQFDGQQVLRKAFNDASGNLKTEIDGYPAGLAPNASQEQSGNLALLQQMMILILRELKAIRLATATLASQGNLANIADFDPQQNDFDSIDVQT